jgi:hypothetical protein
MNGRKVPHRDIDVRWDYWIHRLRHGLASTKARRFAKKQARHIDRQYQKSLQAERMADEAGGKG